MTDKPTVLFVCVHNAGRSQMAAGWLRHVAGDSVEVRSAGSEPADQINPVAVQAMREVGIEIAAEQPRKIAAEQPRKLEYDTARDSDVIVTMGCGGTCPSSPANTTKTKRSRTRPGGRSRSYAPCATKSAPASRSCSPTGPTELTADA